VQVCRCEHTCRCAATSQTMHPATAIQHTPIHTVLMKLQGHAAVIGQQTHTSAAQQSSSPMQPQTIRTVAAIAADTCSDQAATPHTPTPPPSTATPPHSTGFTTIYQHDNLPTSSKWHMLVRHYSESAASARLHNPICSSPLCRAAAARQTPAAKQPPVKHRRSSTAVPRHSRSRLM
jgi:hypothetical protein